MGLWLYLKFRYALKEILRFGRIDLKKQIHRSFATCSTVCEISFHIFGQVRYRLCMDTSKYQESVQSENPSTKLNSGQDLRFQSMD